MARSRCWALRAAPARPRFLYRVAEAAAYGKKFMGQLDCVKGNVLVIQKDESDSNLAQKDLADVP